MADAENAAPAAPESAPVAEPVSQEAAPAAPVEGQPAPEAKEELKQEVKSQLKKLKIKVDGKELEKELDLANEEELIKMLQLSEMSGKRAQEAAELRKKSQARESELNNFLEILKSNPELILKEMGRDPVKFAEELLAAEVEKMQMDPKERRIKELEAELKKEADARTAAKKAQEEAQRKAVTDRYAADYQKDLTEAISSGKLPNDPQTINKMVDYMKIALDQGIDVSFKDLIPLVQENRKASVRDVLKGMSAEELMQILSEQTMNDLVIKKMPKKEKKEVPPTAQQIKDTGDSQEEDFFKPKIRNKSLKDFINGLGQKYGNA